MNQTEALVPGTGGLPFRKSTDGTFRGHCGTLTLPGPVGSDRTRTEWHPSRRHPEG